MPTFETTPSAVDAAVLDRPPQINEAQMAEIEKLVNELSPDQLARLHESTGPELERINSLPQGNSQIQEVGIEDVFTEEERADAELVESQKTEEVKKSSWWKTSLKVIGYGGIIAAGLAAGHYLGAGSMLWQAATEAGPIVADFVAQAAELATAGYEALADGVVSLAEGSKEVLQNMGILSDVSGEGAAAAGDALKGAAEGLNSAEGLGGAAEGLLNNPPGLDHLPNIMPDTLPPSPLDIPKP
jgi:hypothetical protein